MFNLLKDFQDSKIKMVGRVGMEFPQSLFNSNVMCGTILKFVI